GGESAGLVALGTRLERGRRTMFGADLSLWLLDGDAQGRVLLSFARRGVGRWLELGGGIGAHVGAGYGPAGSLSLRVHVPPVPRAAGYLRYDAAYLVDGDARTGQHALTLGLEWGF
ncbi:MAG: hypothetical protein H0T89_04450, partial [Deltaproteobacteria bacterium]|nr:hypothetical protein [Deltaproteobacteria bacterium]